jgi:hypothetical protein
MNSLPTVVLAFRGMLIWVTGVTVIAAVSGYTARPSHADPVSPWLFIPIALAQIALAVACGLFSTIAASAVRALGEVPAEIAGVASFLASLWFSYIAVQFAQNAAYRFVGAEAQRIRWIEPTKKRRRKKR